MGRTLHSDTLLGITFGATCSRNRYTTDPGPVIAELLDIAAERGDVLAMEAGRWAGYYDDEHTAALVAATVREIPEHRH